MDTVTLKVNTLCKAELDYDGKCGHTIGQIKHISLMRIIKIFYTP